VAKVARAVKGGNDLALVGRAVPEVNDLEAVGRVVPVDAVPVDAVPVDAAPVGVAPVGVAQVGVAQVGVAPVVHAVAAVTTVFPMSRQMNFPKRFCASTVRPRWSRAVADSALVLR
tara:strand:+ start:33 stop:380 length:348 start_codon:yes stop_codon:yes gene_type:complete